MNLKKMFGVVAMGASLLLSACEEKAELIQPEPETGDVSFTVNGVSFTMKKVEGGHFRMGSDGYLFDVVEDEMPTHNVSLSTFHIGETEVTQALWTAVMGDNPSAQSVSDGSSYPVENVSWNDCQLFIERLNQLTGRIFGLPTEAQWEFAARGGMKDSGNKYSGSGNIQTVGWFADNAPAPRQVKQKEPNELGLYDMTGNVGEWCRDWYGLYSNTFQENPLGHHSGTRRVVRGGNWTAPDDRCRNTSRDAQSPEYHSSAIGLRLVLRY